jgi:predicted enzyme related to lactoylglutathione lyase
MAAATLRIPDLLAEGRHDLADLASAAGCDRDVLHAVLGHLVAKGVFQEQAPGTGQPAYQKVFGRPFWEDLAAHPDVAADFDALMGPAGHGTPDYDIELAGGWDAVRTMVDVGGGTGAMLAALLRRHPHVRGILVDLPGTVAQAGQPPDLKDRITRRGQSFFDPLPAGADLYLLKNVLNDWPDRETVAILRNCAQAAGKTGTTGTTGTIAVLGGVAADDAPRRAPWASTCWWPAARPNWPAKPAWTSSPPAPNPQAATSSNADPSESPRKHRQERHMTQEDAEAARARGLVHGQVCYLQMPAVDAVRAAAFYQAVFGWPTEHPDQDFESPGLIGQWVPGRPAALDAGPMIWIHVADLSETPAQVARHGGEVIDPRHRTARTGSWPPSSTRKATPSAWPATR